MSTKSTLNVLKVSTQEEKILFVTEFAGQISDGMWESVPGDHWQVWTGCEVQVCPENPGRNFWARKDNYNLASKSLLEVVGDRMLFTLNLIMQDGLPEEIWRELPEGTSEHLFTSSDPYFVARREKLATFGVTQARCLEIQHQIENKVPGSFTYMDMRKAITRLRNAMKTFNA